MATLILGTVGRAIGGPLGGIVGTLVGGVIDRSVFGGGSKAGPRLADLSVQSAAYGQPLPKIYGRMRVAGNLVWTAGITASSQHGGGKSGGATSSYSYSSSFAVIVASRAIVGLGRIWADGKLLRATDGTLNFPATIRTYLGDEEQAVDPLIAAAEGVGQAPAYRGRAYVVFENLPLADYGNRIPNLTFEVVGDTAPVALDAVAVDLAAGTLASAGGFPAVAGFAATQAGTLRQALTTLATIADLSLGDDGAVLRLGVGQAATPLAVDDLGATDKAAVVPQRHETREAETAVPDAIWLAYGDLARDYQTGIQAATRRTPAMRIEQRDLTIAATAGDAKVLAGTALRRAVASRTTAQFALPWRYATVRPGDLILAGADDLPWRVTHRTITGAVIDIDAERVAGSASAALPPADAGRVFIGPDAPQGPTTFHVLDLPALPGALPGGPSLLVAASGADAGWRRADLLVSRDGGDSYALAAAVGAPATIGQTVTVLPAGSTARWDRRSTVDVELLSDEADLQSATEAAVLAGANLAVIGDEIIQFATVVALGGRRFRLSTLLRGRRGSEDAVAAHAADDRFVVLDARVVAIDVPAEALGATLRIKAVGPHEDVAAVAAQTVVPRGVSLRPLSPADLAISAPGGDRVVRWTRRSRTGYAWSDGTDAPLAEDSERYHVTVRSPTAILREADTTATTWTYAAADQVADAAAPGGRTIDVAQVSAVVGLGRPASVDL